MSRPRKPFGSTGRGRLPSTMMRVLSAEMSDPQRHRRGKRYAADDAVLDITIEPGIVTCEVQGSRATPYLASLLVRPGDGMPLRRDVTAHCTCPDDENFEGHACKHVIATMYAFSDELMIEPELLDLWRGNSIAPDRDGNRDDGSGEGHEDDQDDESGDRHGDDGDDSVNEQSGHDRRSLRRRRHLTLVSDRRSTALDDEHADEPPDGDPLAHHLAAPAGTALPAPPVLEPLEQPAPARPELAAVLRDALGHARVEWD
jgi:hypothetical protein